MFKVVDLIVYVEVFKVVDLIIWCSIVFKVNNLAISSCSVAVIEPKKNHRAKRIMPQNLQ